LLVSPSPLHPSAFILSTRQAQGRGGDAKGGGLPLLLSAPVRRVFVETAGRAGSRLRAEARGELFRRQPGALGQLRDPSVVAKILLADSHHVVARDPIAFGVNVNRSLPAAARRRVNHLLERDGLKLAAACRNHSACAAAV